MADGELYKDKEEKKPFEIKVPYDTTNVDEQLPAQFRLEAPDPLMMEQKSKEASITHNKEKDYVQEQLEKMEGNAEKKRQLKAANKKAQQQAANQKAQQKNHSRTLDPKIEHARNEVGPIRKILLIPNNQILTKEYAGKLRTDLLKRHRDAKKTDLTSRLHEKDLNARRINDATNKVEEESQAKIAGLQQRYPNFDDETIKSLSYFAINGNDIISILDQITVHLFKIDLHKLMLDNDSDMALQSRTFEQISCQVRSYDALLAKNPGFLDSISKETREKIEKKITELRAVAYYYDARKSLITDQFFLDHYNEELTMDVDENSPEDQRKVAEKLIKTYILGKRLLRINGETSMNILAYGAYIPKNAYTRKIIKEIKEEYCKDENTGAYAINSLRDAIGTLRASGSFWGDSHEMKQVKEDISRVEAALDTRLRDDNFDAVKIQAIKALSSLDRTCEMYIKAKVKDLRTDSSKRHLSIINIWEASKLAQRYFLPVTKEVYKLGNADPKAATFSTIMRDSDGQIEKNEYEEKKTRTQLARERHFEISGKTYRLTMAGSKFDNHTEHVELLKKLREKIPTNPELFKDKKEMLERGYTDLIKDCDKYLAKKHDADRMVDVREIRNTYRYELSLIQNLDFYKINKTHGNESWEKQIIGGVVQVVKQGNKYISDDERKKITLDTSPEAKQNCAITNAVKAMGFESAIFKNYEEANVLKEDGTYQKSIITSDNSEGNQSWRKFSDIIGKAQEMKGNMIYSDAALRQLSSIQIIDELFGIEGRDINSFRYLIRAEFLLGEPTIIIDAVRIEKPLKIVEKPKRKDGDQTSIYNKDGKLRLPAYDRYAADKILDMKPEEFLANLKNQGVEISKGQKEAFISRLNRLKGAYKDDLIEEKGWRAQQERKESERAGELVSAHIKEIQVWYTDGIDETNASVKKKLDKIDHYKLHPEFADSNTFSKAYKRATKDRQYIGYARREFLTDNSGKEVPFKDITDKQIGKDTYRLYESRQETIKAKRDAFNDYRKKYKPKSEKIRSKKKEDLLNSLTQDLTLEGMDEKFYSALNVFKNYAEMNITGLDVYEWEDHGNTASFLYKDALPHKEATVLKESMRLIRERIQEISNVPENDKVLAEKEVLQKYADRYKEITSGRLMVPRNANAINVKDDDFIDVRDCNADNWKQEKKVYAWKTIDEPLFSHEPCVDDVLQGRVGDCYMLAALAAVVEKNPEFIRNIMKENDDNTVTVRFFDGNSPKYVTVSKTVPVEQNGTSRFARGALWVQMIEKAYVASGLVSRVKEYDTGSHDNEDKYLFNDLTDAKVVSYDSIAGGGAGKFMGILGGITTESVEFSGVRTESKHEFDVGQYALKGNETDFLALIRDLDKRPNVAVTVSTRDRFELEDGVGLNGEKMMRGIASKHAYTVMGSAEMENERYVVLRNPWGSGTVQADFNKVTGAISIKATGTVEGYTGAFLVPLQTFLYMFESYTRLDLTRLAGEEKDRKTKLSRQKRKKN